MDFANITINSFKAINCSQQNELSLPLDHNPDLNCSHIHSSTKVVTPVFPHVFYILSLLGILGNLLNIWTCVWHATSSTIATIGILNLALCDLAFLASMPTWAIYLSNSYRWNMGYLTCVIMNTCYFLGLTPSTMFICAISTDRFLAIMLPLKSWLIQTPKNAVLVSLIIWALTILLIYLSFPNILYRKRSDRTHCCGALVLTQVYSSRAVYNLLSYYSVQVAVPLIIVIPSYIKIVIRVVQSRQRWGNKNVDGQFKTIRLIMVYIAIFLVCWLPGQLLQVLGCIIFLSHNNCESGCWVSYVVNLLMEVSQALYLLNSCLNPLIFQWQQGLGQKLWLWCREVV